MGIHGGHRKKTQHARSRDRWLRGPRSRPDRYWTDPRHAKTVQVLKANSSRWMNDHPGVRFGWQVGYFACSVSRSQVPTVRQYIASQKEHHQKIDSATEFELLLKRHGFELRD